MVNGPCVFMIFRLIFFLKFVFIFSIDWQVSGIGCSLIASIINIRTLMPIHIMLEGDGFSHILAGLWFKNIHLLLKNAIQSTWPTWIMMLLHHSRKSKFIFFLFFYLLKMKQQKQCYFTQILLVLDAIDYHHIANIHFMLLLWRNIECSLAFGILFPSLFHLERYLLDQ